MKYWAYINNEIKGPFEPQELVKVDGFSQDTLICPQSSVEEETKEWKEAHQIPEVALLITSNLSSKAEEISEPKELSNIDKKDEIIIERFSVENIFTPVKDVNQTVLSTDPLTLSQIRKKVESVSENATTAKDEFDANQQAEEQSKIKNTPEEKSISPEVSISQTEDLEKSKTPEDVSFEVPSTDDFLKETQNLEIHKIREAKVEGEVKPEVEEFKSEIKEFSINAANNLTEQTSLSLTKEEVDRIIASKIDEIKNNLIDELSSVINEKISAVELKLKELKSSSTGHFDVSVLKDEVINEIEKKISTLSANLQPQTQIDESFKKNFNDLKVFVSHLEIEIKDLRTKYEELENKIKPQPASLSREKIEETKPNIPLTQSLENKQNLIQTPTLESDEEKKPSKFPKILLGIVFTLLAVLSIFFTLKQFGVFDITSIFKSKQQSTINTQTPPQPQTPLQQQLQQTDIKDIEKDTSSIETPQPPQQTQAEKQEEKEPQIPLETIINEVKDYKIKSPYNLETTIKMVLKSKKADLSTLKWEASLEENGKYLITVVAKALKPIEFKFEFDYKTKILQPLNTLSVNTLNMLMETSDKKTENLKNSSHKKKTQKSQTKRPKTIKKDLLNQADENSTSETLIESSGEDRANQPKSQTEEGNDEEYLIIGE